MKMIIEQEFKKHGLSYIDAERVLMILNEHLINNVDSDINLYQDRVYAFIMQFENEISERADREVMKLAKELE